MIGIYMIRNLINDKKYIGQSVDIERRFKEHKNRMFYTEYETCFYRALKKYGIENFSFEILEICKKEEMDEKEKEYIQKFKTYVKENGYNFTTGGKGYSGEFTEEHKQKLAASKTGVKNPLYNKTPSKETLLKRSLALKGKKKPDSFKEKMSIIHKGKIISEETREKLRNANLGKKHSEETKEKMRGRTFVHSEEAKEKIKEKLSKPRLQYTLENVFIKEFSSAKQAQEETHINEKNISACCNNKRKSAGGYIWKFKTGG